MTIDKFVKPALIIGAAFFFYSIVSAQPREDRRPPHDGPPPPEQLVAEMKKQLNLSDDQVAKIKEIFKNQRTEMRKDRHQLEERREEEMEAMREKMEKQREETNKKIAALLTPEQKKKFDEMKKEREQRFDKHPPGKRVTEHRKE